MLLCSLFYEAISLMSYLVLFCSCVFQSFLHCDYLAWGRERANLSVFLYVCSICACMVMSVASSSCCLGRAVVCDCGTPWTFLLPFFDTEMKLVKLAKAVKLRFFYRGPVSGFLELHIAIVP